jgi:hypothetical protein
VSVYGACLWLLWKQKERGSAYFYGLLTVVYAGFFIQITAPFQPWYFLWAIPWLILAGKGKSTIPVLLISAVGLLSFWKRINYLSVMALAFYGMMWFSTRFKCLRTKAV